MKEKLKELYAAGRRMKTQSDWAFFYPIINCIIDLLNMFPNLALMVCDRGHLGIEITFYF